MFRRSRHIAISVMPDQVEEAVAHYRSLFGLEEASRTEDSIELVGTNWTLLIDRTDKDPGVLHEWVTNDGAAARRAVENSTATITGESHCGFYVRDPYGMTYHVFIDDEAET
jgi:catechol 2,3-dioxygenase-like lactoylglutathione lyase family enzyme